MVRRARVKQCTHCCSALACEAGSATAALWQLRCALGGQDASKHATVKCAQLLIASGIKKSDAVSAWSAGAGSTLEDWRWAFMAAPPETAVPPWAPWLLPCGAVHNAATATVDRHTQRVLDHNAMDTEQRGSAHGAGKQKQHTSGLGAAAKACAMANDGAAAAAPTSAACVSSCCCNLVADLPE